MDTKIMFLFILFVAVANAASFVKRSANSNDDNVQITKESSAENDFSTIFPNNFESKNINSEAELRQLRARMLKNENLDVEEDGKKLANRMARFIFDFANSDSSSYSTDGSRGGNLFNLNLDANAIQEVS